MTGKQRLKVFAVGFLFGCIVVAIIKSYKTSQDPAPVDFPTWESVQREAVPGIVRAYQERGVPMESHFVKSERWYPTDDPTQMRRIIILEGEREGQTLRIEEWVQKGEGRFVDTIVSWKIMSADHLKVETQPGVEPQQLVALLKENGYQIEKKLKSEDGAAAPGNQRFVVSIPGRYATSISDAIDYLESHESVVLSAEEIFYEN